MFGYWQGRLTEAFLEKIHADDGILVNLASSEMKRLFDWKRIRREARIITPEFRIREGDRLKTIVVYTKMCRGEMTRHLIRNLRLSFIAPGRRTEACPYGNRVVRPAPVRTDGRSGRSPAKSPCSTPDRTTAPECGRYGRRHGRIPRR